MHELSLAESIRDITLDYVEMHPGRTVNTIGVRLGAVSDVFPPALEFGFNIARRGTAVSSADLAIEVIPAKGRCRLCRLEFAVDDFLFVCPDCSGSSVELISGQELEISYYDYNEPSPTT